MLTAIIVDDEELAIKRLRSLLSEHTEIEIINTFMDPWEAYAFVKENTVHIAFLDISMSEINGLILSKLLRNQNPCMDIVFETGYDDYAVQAFDMCALDYLMKPVTQQRLTKTLDRIQKRHQVTQTGLSEIINLPEENILTEQEKKTLRLIAKGFSNKEIAYQLVISTETVKTHIKGLYRKLGAKNRVQAVQRAREIKILI